MSANTTPIFPTLPKVKVTTKCTLTANTAMDGTGNLDTIFTAGVNGAKVDQIIIRPLGQNAATCMRLFVDDGTSKGLAHEVELAATSALQHVTAMKGIDVTVPKNAGEYACPISYLPPNGSIKACIGTAATAGFSIIVSGGDY